MLGVLGNGGFGENFIAEDTQMLSNSRCVIKQLKPVVILDYVHSKGMVHRDIKPDNIILRSFNGKPVLINFGAVKVTMRTEVAPFVQANSS